MGSAGDARRHPGRGTGGSSNAADVDPTPATLGNGVRFRETITGSLRVNGVSRATWLTLHAHIAGWRHFINDPNHPISLSGPSTSRDLAPPARLPAHSSSFPIPEMSHRLQTRQDNGEALILTGTKHQHRSPLRLWSDLTTLRVEAADTVGILRISPLGTLKLASSIRGNAFTRTKRAKAAARFLTYFTKSALRGMTLDRPAAQGRDRPNDRAA
jgi:cholesterol oxidase